MHYHFKPGVFADTARLCSYACFLVYLMCITIQGAEVKWSIGNCCLQFGIMFYSLINMITRGEYESEKEQDAIVDTSGCRCRH